MYKNTEARENVIVSRASSFLDYFLFPEKNNLILLVE